MDWSTVDWSSFDFKGLDSSDSDDEDQDERKEPDISLAPPEAKFLTLRDNSTALLIQPATRLKLNLSGLLETGMNVKNTNTKQHGGAQMTMGSYAWMKENINEWTITMDLQLLSDPPRDGLSLLQTKICHVLEDKSGRKSIKSSNGECIINSAGTCLNFITHFL